MIGEIYRVDWKKFKSGDEFTGEFFMLEEAGRSEMSYEEKKRIYDEFFLCDEEVC